MNNFLLLFCLLISFLFIIWFYIIFCFYLLFFLFTVNILFFFYFLWFFVVAIHLFNKNCFFNILFLLTFSLLFWSFLDYLISLLLDLKLPIKWVFSWAVKFELYVNLLPQLGYEQTYGFSPVCVRKWVLKLKSNENLLLQISHLYGFSPVWTS